MGRASRVSSRRLQSRPPWVPGFLVWADLAGTWDAPRVGCVPARTAPPASSNPPAPGGGYHRRLGGTGLGLWSSAGGHRCRDLGGARRLPSAPSAGLRSMHLVCTCLGYWLSLPCVSSPFPAPAPSRTPCAYVARTRWETIPGGRLACAGSGRRGPIHSVRPVRT